MKHVLVTGGAGAIGSALGRAFHARLPDAAISLADVDGEGARRATEPLGVLARSLTWDLSQPHELPEALGALERERGPVDVLVNCAGIMEIRSLAVTPWALAERLIAVDLVSPLRLMHLVAPGMVERGAGCIVNVSSMAGITPLRGCALYGAAKAGIAMASEIARLELSRHGVDVITVYPGPVRSELERRARAQAPDSMVARLLPTGDADALARRIVDAWEHRRPRVVYPAFYDLASRFPTLAGRLTRAVSPQPLDA
ncbi:MAG TPA: SDR family NAD(P)-dependent oxidoreductase [Polyangiaceae bacterium]